MDYPAWQGLYRQILLDFGFSESGDALAAMTLDSLMKGKKICPKDKLSDMLSGNRVAVFGAAHDIDRIVCETDFSAYVKIAADGATGALTDNGIVPDIIVTDLDGDVALQVEANRRGTIAVIHAHGDNIPALKEWVPRFGSRIIGTVQCDPAPYGNLHNFGGFTDGDRAALLASHFNASEIILAGFDYSGRIGSRSGKYDYRTKLKKLEWCRRIIDFANDGRMRYFEKDATESPQ
ncbi:MAG: hypothetical protein CVT48_01280 [Thermoplasmata archaeon HGW-Thermoplasmata-1]|nr:MAG: hypothetical protein CVT48_01280 [Thermoplasmata archaeon HGW-Thermoplasmata-1]